MTTEATARSPSPGEEPATPAPDPPGWDGPVNLPDLWRQLRPGTTVTLARIVGALHHSTNEKRRAEAQAAERALLQEFIEQNGRLVDFSYSLGVIAGCALTERTHGDGDSPGITRTLHTVINQASPQQVEMEMACHQLMTDANAIFGRRRSVSVQQKLADVSQALYSAMTRVVRLAGTPADDPRREEIEQAAAGEVEVARRNVGKAILREAGFHYFTGMLLGAAVTVAICAGLGWLSYRYWSSTIDAGSFVGAIVFGALGAVASVFQRVSADRVVLAFTPSRSRLLTLGGVRPLVGATFGAVAYFALVGGVLSTVTDAAGPTAGFGLAAVTGFAAGFTERFATDVVKRAGENLLGGTSPPPEQRGG